MSNKLARDRKKEFINKLRRKLCKNCQREIKEWASPTCAPCKKEPLSRRIFKRITEGKSTDKVIGDKST